MSNATEQLDETVANPYNSRKEWHTEDAPSRGTAEGLYHEEKSKKATRKEAAPEQETQSGNTNYKNTFVTFIEQSSFFGAKEASETTEDHKRRLEKAFKEQEMLSHMISNDSVKESLLSRSLPHSKHDIETYDKFAELLKQKQSPATT